MSKVINVKKRDNTLVPLDCEKINKQLLWATEGLRHVSASEIALKAELHFTNGVRSQDIQSILIKTAADMISPRNPDYQYVAARLMMFDLRKQVLGQYEPIALTDFINMNRRIYDMESIGTYDPIELAELDRSLDHERDFNFAYAGLIQMKTKYLLGDKVNDLIFELPQYVYMLIGMVIFHKYPRNTRLKMVKRFYDAASNFEISLPTPIMMNVRTPLRQYSSCVGIDIGDTIKSWYESNSAVGIYTSQSAGIGLNMGRWRGLGAGVRQGRVQHTGAIPVLRMLEATVKSCTQSGARGGSATVYYPFFHWEFEDLIVLKNNKGTEENRVRHLDYGVQLHKIVYERYINDEEITLFSNEEVPGLYDSFGTPDFQRVYEEAERKHGIRKKKIKARDMVHTILLERFNTGRIYIMNMDHANDHSSFLDTVTHSNLCAEITIPSSPIENIYGEDGEIFVCILSNINMGVVKIDKLPEVTDLLVRVLDEVISFQEYPIDLAKKNATNRRSLGIGVMNLAYWLAKNDLSFDDDNSRKELHRYMEHFQYGLIKSSVELAKEKGPCEYLSGSKFSKGILPIDTYKKELDEIVPNELECDWETLRADMLKYGIRNSALSAVPPSETSSVISNATNGIDPLANLETIKKNKNFAIKQLAPQCHKIGHKYDYVYEKKGFTNSYLKTIAVIQKFVCQSISTNTYYNPELFETNDVPMSVLVGDLFTAYKYGIKTLYYSKVKPMRHNKSAENGEDVPKDDNDVIEEEEGCAGGACSV